jgi:hypothetical protein
MEGESWQKANAIFDAAVELVHTSEDLLPSFSATSQSVGAPESFLEAPLDLPPLNICP